MIDIFEQSSATTADILSAFYDQDPAVVHRNTYRGKSLGSSFTAAQKAAIADGSFDDLFVGDYWTLNSRVYRIADINYYLGLGDTPFEKNHLVIVPDASFGNNVMNSSNITTNGYTNSKMYTDTTTPSVLNSAKSTIATDFGENFVASHRILIPTTTSSGGVQTASDWFDSTVDLMNEVMVYGCWHNAIENTGTNTNTDTIETRQLALFALNPRLIHNGRYTYWLRDVVSSTGFANVSNDGNANYHNASNSLGVRPAFCVVGS